MLAAEHNVPTTIIILGGTGDLSQKKLLPALLDLYVKERLPDTFRIVGFARRGLSDTEFRAFVKEAIGKKGHTHPAERIDAFVRNCTYRSGLFDREGDYLLLKERILEIDAELGLCTNKLIYLAVPPEFYGAIFERLSSSNISSLCSGVNSWTRILVEKPFGNDLATAQALDRKLGELFREEQIFRIDHYLAKETLQNILMFRFSNSLFEPLWGREHIERVEIIMHESGGIGTRGSFYEGVGALRDVGQNHLLQMLALIAMEHPGSLGASSIRSRRAEVFRRLRGVTMDDVIDRVRRGQYEGYRAEANVSVDSETETFFSLTTFVDTPRWIDVPFILEAGKKMSSNTIEIRIHFRETIPCLCPPGGPHHHRNKLVFRIQPDEGIAATFWAKVPGFDLSIEPRTLEFSYGETVEEHMIPDAYERVLFDCIRGDQALFASTDEVQASWEFITPILSLWGSVRLETYAPNTRPTLSVEHS